MIDIHTHILPGLDDGSPSWDVSIRMLELAAETGTTEIIATAHSDLDEPITKAFRRQIETLSRDLTQYAAEQGLRLRIVPGMEIFASDDIRRKIEEGLLIGLNRSRYYMVEFPFDAPLDYIHYILQEMQMVPHVVPVIAHPERYFALQEHPDALYTWLMEGCLGQINKGSLFGRFGEESRRTALYFTDHNLIAAAASDAHSDYSRRPVLADGWDLLTDLYCEPYARLVMETYPRRILRDEAFDMRATARRTIRTEMD